MQQTSRKIVLGCKTCWSDPWIGRRCVWLGCQLGTEGPRKRHRKGFRVPGSAARALHHHWEVVGHQPLVMSCRGCCSIRLRRRSGMLDMLQQGV